MSVLAAVCPESSRSFQTVKMFFFVTSCDGIISRVCVCARVRLCARGSANSHVSAFPATYGLNEHTGLYTDSSDVPGEQGGRKRDPYETEVSDILLSFIECEAKQEWRTAVSSQTQREADEEQKRERGREERERGRGRERALRSVIFTDVAAALGQTLPVFCVHLRLVSPVLL